ncbi:hypothetical protein [Phaffia rhodozyma]|uniref:Uncharacterized protein n=1 Tax=Phaffia rhodozyma TaxID=264483 RepID=A0A0F7SFE4_PHARH|nr:hypothetical protein [Phaffia rhodozyma]
MDSISSLLLQATSTKLPSALECQPSGSSSPSFAIMESCSNGTTASNTTTTTTTTISNTDVIDQRTSYALSSSSTTSPSSTMKDIDLYSTNHSRTRTRTRTLTRTRNRSNTIPSSSYTALPSAPTQKQQVIRRSIAPSGPIEFDLEKRRTGTSPSSSPERLVTTIALTSSAVEDKARARARTRTKTEGKTGGIIVTSLGGVQEPFLPIRANKTPLKIPELLRLIFLELDIISPASLASCLAVSRFFFEVGASVLWREVRFEDCSFIFKWDMDNKALRRKNAIVVPEMSPSLDLAYHHRLLRYTTSITSVHITEVIKQGQAVDVMILRRKYPLMLPFVNLRSVVLHRLSPHAFYKEEFVYSVKFPEMWFNLSATKCAHQLDILNSSTAHRSTRHIYVLPSIAAMASMPRLADPTTLVWIQTSVFVHYQHLTEFVLHMPSTWSLEARHASDLLRAIASSPNKGVLRKLVISCPVPANPLITKAAMVLNEKPVGAMILSSLQSLEEVEFESALDDQQVRVLARSWKNLRKLTLRTPALADGLSDRTGRYFSPRLTILSLRYLATYCVRLEELDIDLRSVVRLAPGQPLPIPVFSRALQKLTITGWEEVPVEFLAQIAVRSVPLTCVLEFKQVALDGVEDLFELDGMDKSGIGREESRKIAAARMMEAIEAAREIARSDRTGKRLIGK